MGCEHQGSLIFVAHCRWLPKSLSPLRAYWGHSMDEDIRSALYVIAGVLIVAFFNMTHEAAAALLWVFHLF